MQRTNHTTGARNAYLSSQYKFVYRNVHVCAYAITDVHARMYVRAYVHMHRCMD